MGAYKPSFTYKNPIYQPAMRVISSITNAFQATVTTTVPHLYLVGTIVRFDIPLLFGMQQLNQQIGTILTIPTSTTFTINLDTSLMDPFTLPATFPPQYQDAQVVQVGAQNDMVNYRDVKIAVQNTLPQS